MECWKRSHLVVDADTDTNQCVPRSSMVMAAHKTTDDEYLRDSIIEDMMVVDKVDIIILSMMGQLEKPKHN